MSKLKEKVYSKGSYGDPTLWYNGENNRERPEK